MYSSQSVFQILKLGCEWPQTTPCKSWTGLKNLVCSCLYVNVSKHVVITRMHSPHLTFDSINVTQLQQSPVNPPLLNFFQNFQAATPNIASALNINIVKLKHY